MKEMGLAERLRENNEVIWHWDIPGRETLLQAREAKVYLASANGVSETGRTGQYRRNGKPCFADPLWTGKNIFYCGEQ